MTKNWDEMGKKDRAQYLHNFKQLYSKPCAKPLNSIEEVKAKVVKTQNSKKTRENCLLEWQEQAIFTIWLNQQGCLYTASANGGVRSKWEGSKLKRMGVKAGHPDIVIYEPRDIFHGLFIELKRTKGGTISPEQEIWIARLKARGYAAYVAYGAQQAIKIAKEYLDETI